jgi:hypothetical protein
VAINDRNQRVTIIGFSSNYIKENKFDKAKKEELEKMALTMKYVKDTKAVCLFQEKNLVEIIECDPSTLTPISPDLNESSPGGVHSEGVGSISILEDTEMQSLLIDTLIKYGAKENAQGESYHEKIKTDTILSQLVKVFEY